MSTQKCSEPSLKGKTEAFVPPWFWVTCQAEGRDPSTSTGLPRDTGSELELEHGVCGIELLFPPVLLLLSHQLFALSSLPS